jgi:hypothetical protein
MKITYRTATIDSSSKGLGAVPSTSVPGRQRPQG